MTVKSIVLSKNQIDTLRQHSQKNSPNEACAILFGKTDNGNVIVKEVFLTKNIENSPVNFTISPEELILAYDTSERENLEVSAIFHSHPSSMAHPSTTDKKYMEINPVPWVIFSNMHDEFKAYIYDLDLVPVPVKIL
ncbi:Mov34/MPN/PAD-1 family protein [Candidatus Nitrosotalea bavarica]|uniref:Mov34/MPN/PAD-1 family protein n=1 Tax=Candidatus Nitrosotalea bavarica TaxID=1903277 RepID=UPI000C6FD0C3|nr:M67 family metallopeptidase [Candidatus Nitrosotalea bavarica]